MPTTDLTQKEIHHGRNIKRFREMFRLKQAALATELGYDWSQKKVSRLEEHEKIEESILSRVAAILKVPAEAIKNFDEQAAVVYFNTFSKSSASGAYIQNGTLNVNPIEQLMQLVEENKLLYGKLLQSERQIIALLEQCLDNK